MTSEFRAKFGRLPKAELHLHLRGALPPELLARLLDKYGTRQALDRASPGLLAFWQRCPNLHPFLSGESWTPADLEGLWSYGTFDQFLGTYAFSGFFFRQLDDFRALVSAVLDGLAAQGIVYAEVIVSLSEYLLQGFRLPELLGVLNDASHSHVKIGWLVDPVRNFGAEAALKLLAEVGRSDPQPLVGLTLGGSEHEYPPELFEGVYRLARELGLRRTVHAGEALGPASVRTSLDLLQTERVGHGVRSIEDPALVARLADEGIPLEVCPTSNLCTGVYRSWNQHPLVRLHRAGVTVTLNTDDPTFFGCTLSDEADRALELGATESELLELLVNGWRAAFLPENERQAGETALRAAWRLEVP